MKRVIALGFFDGVHLGHGALLNKARQQADRLGCSAAALTFDCHPAQVIGGKAMPLICTVCQREQLMRTKYAMDEVLILPFDRAMMDMPWQQFAQQILKERFEAQAVVCGADYTFGSKGAGNAGSLRSVFGEHCHVIEPVMLDGSKVSSTRIRQALDQGEIEQVNRMLGYDYFFSGTVIHGKHLGRKIGIPTANLLLPPNVVKPAYGVYASRVNGMAAVTNIGIRPTLDDGEAPTVESRILDFDGNLYGKTVTVELLHYLRPERKFANVEELKQQILRDTRAVLQIINR